MLDRPGVTVVSLEDENQGINVHARPRSGLEMEKLLRIRSWTLSTLRYFIFLCVFSIVVFVSRDGQTSYFFTDQLRNVFLSEEFPPEFSHVLKTFYDVSKPEEFFQWLLGPFLEGMYPNRDYNGDAIPADQLRSILGYDKVVGLVRLRQLRVRANTCTVAPKFRSQIDACYSPYKTSTASKEPFGPGGKWKFATDPRERVFSGFNGILQLYPDNGFYLDLPKDRANASLVLNGLFTDHWVDLYTRMIAVEFTVFNTNLKLFCVIRIAFELPDGGGVLPSASFRTVNLLRYTAGSSDMFVIVMEAVLAVFVIVYIAEEAIEVVQACRGVGPFGLRVESGGWRMYFIDDAWNYLDLLNYALFIVVAVFRVISVVEVNAAFKRPGFLNDNAYINFQGLALLQSQELNINAFNMLLCWIKTLKYLSRIDRVNHLSKTLSRSASDTAIFVIIFCIFFFAYAQAGWMMFSTDVYGFRTVTRSAQSLILATFGAFEYDQLELSNRYLAPLFFFSYMLMTSFILLNVFIAIITNAYDSVRENAARKDAEDRVSALLNGRVERLTPWAKVKRTMLIMHDAMFVKSLRRRQMLLERLHAEKADLDDDGVITLDEARQAMELQDGGVEMFTAIDTNDDNVIDQDELRVTLEGLHEEKALIEESLADFLVLEKSLADSGKKLSPEHVEQREELSTQLEDYKRRIKHLGKLAPEDLKFLQIRSPTDGMDPALLAQLQNAHGDGHAELVTVLSNLQANINQNFAGLNSKLRSMTSRLKRLEDDSRAAKKAMAQANVASITSPTGLGAGVGSNPAATAGGGGQSMFRVGNASRTRVAPASFGPPASSVYTGGGALYTPPTP